VHIIPISNELSVVFWGGDGVEAYQLWSFQIAHKWPLSDGKSKKFDPALDAPVDLKKEKVCVLAPTDDTEVGLVELREGCFLVHEGDSVYVDHGDRPRVMVTFPARSKPVINQVILYLD
jgi:hypothetical protein